MISANSIKKGKALHRPHIVDFLKWAEANIILDDGTPIKFLPHQRKILGKALALDRHGKLKYQTVVYSCPKKSGKTTVNGCIVCWFAYEVAPGAEIILAANDFEQAAGRVFREVKKYIQRNPTLMSKVQGITQREITLTNGTVIKAIPSDAAGEAGANQSLSSFDELWGYTSENSRRVYEELTPVPTLIISMRIITSYAGFTGESNLLEEIYNRGKAGKRLWSRLPCWENGSLFMYWDTKPRMPWQTKEYYKAQRQELRQSAFDRLHRNRWVSSESGLFDMDKWDACVNPNHRPPLPSKAIKLFVGVDALVKKDRSAVVSVYHDDDSGLLKLGPKRFWQPSKGQPMDLEETMEKYLLELHQGYRLASVRYDPYQFHRSATTLYKKGLPMEEYPQTVPNLVDMGQNLFDLVEYGSIVLYSCKELRREAQAAIAKEKDRGLQITKEKSSQKIDQIVALAMASIAAAKPTRRQARIRVLDGSSPAKVEGVTPQMVAEHDLIPVIDAQGRPAGYEPRHEEGQEGRINLVAVYESGRLICYQRVKPKYRGKGVFT